MGSQEVLAWRAPLLMVGVGLSAFTSGAIASLSLITVPALLTNTTNASLLTCWRHTLQNGLKVCPSFAVAATIVHVLNAYINRDSTSGRAKYFAAAAASTIAIVPFTMILMAPTNEELFKREQTALGTATGVELSSLELVKKWGRLNLTRAFLPAAGALVACFAL
ncbi:hypothetical protein MMC30_006130 [Trapelia coarctata]|nr:hypothetical protein [Trapelia coarctata]